MKIPGCPSMELPGKMAYTAVSWLENIENISIGDHNQKKGRNKMEERCIECIECYEYNSHEEMELHRKEMLANGYELNDPPYEEQVEPGIFAEYIIYRK